MSVEMACLLDIQNEIQAVCCTLLQVLEGGCGPAMVCHSAKLIFTLQ